MQKTLELIFRNAAGKNAVVSIANPRDNLTSAEVQAVMETIMAKNIFNTSGGDLVAVVEARIVSREVSTLLTA